MVSVSPVSSVPKSYHADLALNLTALWWKVPNSSLKSINKSNIRKNNDFIYINISFILINISLIYSFLRGVEKFLGTDCAETTDAAAFCSKIKTVVFCAFRIFRAKK